jgi:hypothetical protein
VVARTGTEAPQIIAACPYRFVADLHGPKLLTAAVEQLPMFEAIPRASNKKTQRQYLPASTPAKVTLTLNIFMKSTPRATAC